MAGKVRITYANGNTSPNPIVRITSITARFIPPPHVRFTAIQGIYTAGATLRITGVSAIMQSAGLTPVVDAGVGLALGAGEIGHLLGTAETPVGTITSVSWQLVAKNPTNAPPITFDNTAILNPTVRAPVWSQAAGYLYSLKATNSSGIDSPVDFVTITTLGGDLRQGAAWGVPMALLLATAGGWV